jgi:hypothetical protein
MLTKNDEYKVAYHHTRGLRSKRSLAKITNKAQKDARKKTSKELGVYFKLE